MTFPINDTERFSPEEEHQRAIEALSKDLDAVKQSILDDSMASKSAQLEQLFIKWELLQANETDPSWKLTKGDKNITKNHFRRDGIIDY